MQDQEDIQISSPLKSADDTIIEFGFFSAFFAVVTVLLSLTLFFWHIMMFLVLWIVPISTLATLIFAGIVLVKARKRLEMRRSVLLAILSLAIGLSCGVWVISMLSSMMS